VYTLHYRSDTGEAVGLRHDLYPSALVEQAGQPVVGPAEPVSFKPSRRISQPQPGHKPHTACLFAALEQHRTITTAAAVP